MESVLLRHTWQKKETWGRWAQVLVRHLRQTEEMRTSMLSPIPKQICLNFNLFFTALGRLLSWQQADGEDGCCPWYMTLVPITMRLKTSRYCVMLLVQFGLLLVDISVNCFSDFARNTSVVVLLLFIIQDVCLIFALISLVLSLFSTYAFQAGLIELLYDRFRVTVIISTIYLLFTITLHSWSLSERWRHPLEHIWPDGLIWLYVIQRLLAVLYYYHYKRSVLRISDPRFYEDFNWVNHQHDGS